MDVRCGCEVCGNAEPAVEVTFSRNIGMLIMRRAESVTAHHCRACLWSHFVRFQGHNMLLGWWGTISFFMTIVFTLENLRAFFQGRGVLVSGESRVRERLEARDRARESVDAEKELQRFRHTITRRLRAGDTPEAIAADMADAADVPLRKAQAFVEALARPHAAAR